MKKGKMLKRILSSVLSVAMCCNFVAAFAQDDPAIPREGNQNYYSNQGELTDAPFVQLPMGSVQAEGWLKQQLLLQKNGLTGNIQDNYPTYGANNGWRGGNGDTWEKGPYFFRGLTSLAWVLDDAELKAQAMEWINFCLNNQRPNGFFGPLKDGDGSGSNWDWWPRMVAIQTIRDYYEATEQEGTPDERVMPFFEKYFKYQLAKLPSKPLSDYWAEARGGDNIEVVLWYYNRIYDANNPEASQWVLDLANELYKTTYKWTNIFTNTTVREHVVNTTQAMKTPAVMYQITGDDRDKNALREGIFNMGLDHGRVDKLANSDESPRENLPYRGAETCSVVESILSNGMALRILGEGWIGDDIERLAYNSLPASYTPDFTGHCYFQGQNQAMATHGSYEFSTEHGDDVAFGAPAGFECCFPNMHMGWPKFVQNMWMGTVDNGLAIVSYGPNTVTAKVSDGKTAVFKEETNYPFEEAVGLTYEGETASFPLKLRVPEWCDAPEFKVNGEITDGEIINGYFTIEREFTAGDLVEANFLMEVKTSTWYNNSVAVERGPLLYSVKIEEDWRIAETDDMRDINYAPFGQFVRREVYPASAWNYGLVIDPENPNDSFEVVVADEVASQPFSVANAPVTLKVKGQLIPEWKLLGNVVPESPYSPVKPNEALQQEIELIPYGCGRLRIVQIPTIGEPTDTVIRSASTAQVKEQDGETVMEFDNVMVPKANNYTLKINYTGSGTLRMNINTKYNQEISFADGADPVVVENLANIVPGGGYFRFDYGQYNNIRFFGNDAVEITSIEVIPSKKLSKPEIVATDFTKNSAILSTNIDRADGFYQVHYGTESGNYTTAADGFRSSKATITGLAENTTYYFQVSMVLNGETVTSEEVTLTTADKGEGTVNFSDDFANPEQSKSKWTAYDPRGALTFNEGSVSIGMSDNFKLVAGSEDWADYAVEAELTAGTSTRDFGIMFRVSGASSLGADAYQGYYAGIGGKNLVIGYANGAWNQIKTIPMTYQENKTYTLKVAVCGSTIAIYLDGVKMDQFTDTRFATGQVGLRSWNQKFSCSNFAVRPLSDADYADMGIDNPDEPEVIPPVPANFSDDFGDPAISAQKWSLIGDTAKMSFADGKLSFAKSQNVKAVTGDHNWENYVAQSTINLDTIVNNNCGMMFRITGEASGSDSYKGYYFGVGNVGETPSICIGYADGTWHYLKNIPTPIQTGVDYRLKAVISGEKIALYLNDELVYRFFDNRFARGKIGFRTYGESFTVDNVSVRELTPEDETVFDGMRKCVDGEYSLSNGAQVRFGQISGASSYKLVYGTESGVYTKETYDIIRNHRAFDKTSVSGLENGTPYYFKMIAVSGNKELYVSEEFTVTPGERLDITEQREELAEKLAQAEAIEDLGYSESSWTRLTAAIADASAVLANENANMMDVSLAKNNLAIGINELGNTDGYNAVMPTPAPISSAAGTQVNLPVFLTQFPSALENKSIEAVLDIPEAFEVIDVIPTANITADNFAWNVGKEDGKLRIAWLNEDRDPITYKNNDGVNGLFTIQAQLKEAATSDSTFLWTTDRITIKTSDKTVFTDIGVSQASCTVTVKTAAELISQARILYEGDGIDLIPGDKMAVAVEFLNMNDPSPVSFDGITLLYSAEKSAKSSKPTYVALVDYQTELSALNDVTNYAITDGEPDSITFGNASPDDVINAQDALKILTAWLRKNTDPLTDKDILTMNVSADSRIDTSDSIAVVDYFITQGAKEFKVVTK